jgi:hypothetical protein
MSGAWSPSCGSMLRQATIPQVCCSQGVLVKPPRGLARAHPCHQANKFVEQNTSRAWLITLITGKGRCHGTDGAQGNGSTTSCTVGSGEESCVTEGVMGWRGKSTIWVAQERPFRKFKLCMRCSIGDCVLHCSRVLQLPYVRLQAGPARHRAADTWQTCMTTWSIAFCPEP